MTGTRPLIVVTLPGRTLEDIRDGIRRATEAGADVAEVRFDRLPRADLERPEELFPSPLPLMATLRSRREGGEGPSEPSERAPMLRRLFALPFRFLDFEWETDRTFLPAHAGAADPAPIAVLSSHLQDTTATRVRERLTAPIPPGAWLKVVVDCDLRHFWSDILPLLPPPNRGVAYIVHTTGPSGALLRAWSGRFGMAAVYASLPTHPGGALLGPPVEASQIPADRLRRFLDSRDSHPLFAVLGHPVEHSLSPVIHSMWMAAHGFGGLYVALDASSAEEIAESLPQLVRGGLRGLNVTHPWKEVVLGLASRAGRSAEVAGCANTLVIEGRTVVAENTDVAAASRRFSELRSSGAWSGGEVTVLGAGGAARAAVAAARAQGLSVRVMARKTAAAEAIASRFDAEVRSTDADGPTSLLVHATPAGRADTAELAVPWTSLIGPSTYVLDYVYRPEHAFLQHHARARGATYEDGSRLLVYQAAESFGLWWGTPPSLELQERALQEIACGE